MRLPLLLLLAFLALLTTCARAEAPQQGTLGTHIQDFIQKAQERFSTLQASNVVQKLRELTQAGISRTQELIEQAKTHILKLLEKKA